MPSIRELCQHFVTLLLQQDDPPIVQVYLHHEDGFEWRELDDYASLMPDGSIPLTGEIHSAAHTRRRRGTDVDEIHISPITTSVRYAVALHEAGHVFSRLGKIAGEDYLHYLRNQAVRIRAEYGAWAWAEEHALVWTRAMDAVMWQSLCSHFEDFDDDLRF